jgi:hypothetical protein
MKVMTLASVCLLSSVTAVLPQVVLPGVPSSLCPSGNWVPDPSLGVPGAMRCDNSVNQQTNSSRQGSGYNPSLSNAENALLSAMQQVERMVISYFSKRNTTIPANPNQTLSSTKQNQGNGSFGPVNYAAPWEKETGSGIGTHTNISPPISVTAPTSTNPGAQTTTPTNTGAQTTTPTNTGAQTNTPASVSVGSGVDVARTAPIPEAMKQPWGPDYKSGDLPQGPSLPTGPPIPSYSK